MSLRAIFFLALTICAIAFGQWLQIPLPEPLKPVRLSEEPWQLVPMRKASVQQSLAVLAGSSLWGKLPETGAGTSLNDPEWRFVGAVARGKERYVLVKIDNQPDMRLAPGDSLPGGSKIISIENDRLCLMVNGKKRSLNIYPQTQAPQIY